MAAMTAEAALIELGSGLRDGVGAYRAGEFIR